MTFVTAKLWCEFIYDMVDQAAFAVGYDGTSPLAAPIRAPGENLFYPWDVKGWLAARRR
ncbi:hypothetical protein [Paraburkholderia atlantica]|uniref:hypothetical protein n=1 Tax=Paraburkholderia atlantica TaxID=2654982 RepID=UPI003D1C6FC5